VAEEEPAEALVEPVAVPAVEPAEEPAEALVAEEEPAEALVEPVAVPAAEPAAEPAEALVAEEEPAVVAVVPVAVAGTPITAAWWATPPRAARVTPMMERTTRVSRAVESVAEAALTLPALSPVAERPVTIP
jgi:hypothetical protein